MPDAINAKVLYFVLSGCLLSLCIYRETNRYTYSVHNPKPSPTPTPTPIPALENVPEQKVVITNRTKVVYMVKQKIHTRDENGSVCCVHM